MKHIHLIGIGGTGLSAIALFLKERGYTVKVRPRHVTPCPPGWGTGGTVYHRSRSITSPKPMQLCFFRSAGRQPRIVAATRCIPVFKRSEFLGSSGKRRGSQLPNSRKNDYHSLTAWVFHQLGLDQSYIIGGVSKDLGTNAHAGNCDYFIIEADEYDNMFLGLTPHIEVVMSLEHDHPDIFPTRESYNQAFVRFVKRLEYSGTLIACADDKGALWLANNHKRDDIRTLMYGTSPRANYRAENLAPNQRGGFDFTASFHDAFLANVSLKVPGEHNALNALQSS